MSQALLELSNAFVAAVEQAARSVAAIKEGGRVGVSGTFWRPGVIVTADHTIPREGNVTAVLPDGSEISAQIVGGDATTDVGVLKLDGAGEAPVFSPVAEQKVGSFVLAIGRSPSRGVMASSGIISAVGGAWRTWRGGKIDRWFRLDLQPYAGFSGGPLVDAAGRVIGINTSGPRRGVMTIPAATVDRVVERVLRFGRISRGYLGVGVQPVELPEGLRQSLKLQSGRALLVVTVAPGGPAERAGVLLGDVLVSAAGSPLADARDLHAALDPETVGKPLELQIIRGGVLQQLRATVEERRATRG